MFKYFNEFSPSDNCFPYEYIDAEFNKKEDKTKGQIEGDEMENKTKH